MKLWGMSVPWGIMIITNLLFTKFLALKHSLGYVDFKNEFSSYFFSLLNANERYNNYILIFITVFFGWLQDLIKVFAIIIPSLPGLIFLDFPIDGAFIIHVV